MTTKGGFTMLSKYQTCKRQFFFNYMMRIVPERIDQKKLLGSVLHRCIEEYSETTTNGGDFSTGTLEHAIIVKVLPEFPDLEDDFKDYAYQLFSNWALTIGTDQTASYDVVYNNSDGFIVLLPTGFEFIVKPDRIIREKSTGLVFLVETKVTGWSAEKIVNNLERGYQTVVYSSLWNNTHPNEMVNVVKPEIISYSLLKSGFRANPVLFENDLVLNPWKQRTFLATLTALTQELMVTSLMEDSRYYAPCLNCSQGSYFECDYLPVCCEDYTVDSEIPYGFKRKEEYV